jgi:hypothetical protein
VGMELLGERPGWSMSGGELLSGLDAVEAELARLESLRVQFVARVDEIGYPQELGARDTVELLTVRYRRDRAEAWREVRLARALPRYGAVSAGLVDGIRVADPESGAGTRTAENSGSGIDPAEDADGRGVRVLRSAQAAAIVSALERVRSRVPVEDLDVAEEQLVSLASHLSPAELRKAAKEICDLLDADGPEPDEDLAYARESLTLMTADNGVKFKGYLANENAELLRSITFAGARPHKTVDGELDPRSRDKRQADALTTALTIAAAATDAAFTPPSRHDRATTADRPRADAASAGEDAPAAGSAAGWLPGFGAKANITVTIDLEDLKRATANATGDLVYGDALSAAAIRRLACDATVIPLVLGSNSEPLDVGRAERLVTRAMRRALNARDRGCVVCGAPPVQCDAHHLQSWIDGGVTAIQNLVLLCRRHHMALHAGHWTVTITNGEVQVTRPAWADPPPLRADPSPLHAVRPSAATGSSPPGSPTPGSRTASPTTPSCLSPDDATSPPDATSRWRADARALEEAARFAVLGAAEVPGAAGVLVQRL